MGEYFLFASMSALLTVVVLLVGVAVGRSTIQPPLPKPPKPPKKPQVEPMPKYDDPWDNALQGDSEPRIPTVEE